MAAESAGILLYKRKGRGLLVLLVHPGGPFWRNKDDGAWTIPKGERSIGEDAETTARREFVEELGAQPTGTLVPLGRIRQRGGKHVERISGNTFEIEWPPRSGRRQSFPEVDRAAWFSPDEARQKINAGQRPFIDRVEDLCATS
jgi:predicted NUDIX family NTP pyrophosphohydrolase